MNYPIKIFYSEEDKGYIAEIPDLPGCSAFGNTPEKAVKEVKIAQQLWLEVAKSEKRKIPLPTNEKQYSGRILARTPKTLHKQLAEKAREEGVSLNQLVVFLLAEALRGGPHNLPKDKKAA